jgi:hypothetical protein
MLCASIRAEMNYPRCDGGPTGSMLDGSLPSLSQIRRSLPVHAPSSSAGGNAATALDYGLSAAENFFANE